MRLTVLGRVAAKHGRWFVKRVEALLDENAERAAALAYCWGDPVLALALTESGVLMCAEEAGLLIHSRIEELERKVDEVSDVSKIAFTALAALDKNRGLAMIRKLLPIHFLGERLASRVMNAACFLR